MAVHLVPPDGFLQTPTKNRVSDNSTFTYSRWKKRNMGNEGKLILRLELLA